MSGRGRDQGSRAPGYAVGYGRPPKHSRFTKGRSGNPQGRPRGAKNRQVELQPGVFRDLFLQEGQRKITLQDGGRAVTVTMLEAAIRRTFVDALKGRARAQELILRNSAAIEAADQALANEFMHAMIEYKVSGERELERRAREGITDAEELYPHPDDIHVDFAAGNITIRGPMSKEEKVIFDEAHRVLEELRATLAAVMELKAQATDRQQRQELEAFASELRRRIAEIEVALP